MRLTIPHPRIFAVFLVVLVMAGVMSTTLAVTQDDPEPDNWGGYIVEEPGVPRPTPSDDDLARAEALLRESDDFASVVGDTPWTMVQSGFVPLLGRPNTIGIALQLDDPISAEGPWRILDCQGTRLRIVSERWENVVLLNTLIDPNDGTILRLAVRQPIPERDGADIPQPNLLRDGDRYDGPITVVDPRTLDILGAADRVSELPDELLECPPGLADD